MATIAANVAAALSLDQQILALCQQTAAAVTAQSAQIAALQQENADLKADVLTLSNQVAALSSSDGLATAKQVSAVQATVDEILVDVSGESGPADHFVITIQEN